MDILLGYCLRNVTRFLFVVLVATTWTSRAGFSFSRRCMNAKARICTIERAKVPCSFTLSMVHLRAMALMHRREKDNPAQEVHVVATRTTNKILVTFLKQ